MSYVSEKLETDKLQSDLNLMVADYQRLLRFEEDMRDLLPFKADDQVTLKKSYIVNARTQGWLPYKNMLVSGNPATIKDISWNGAYKVWQAGLIFDLQWSESYWHDSVAVFIKKNDSSIFYFDLDKIRELRESDIPPTIPKPGQIVTYGGKKLKVEVNEY